jgi:hypothetical protein
MTELASHFSIGLWAWQTILIINLIFSIYCLIDILRHNFKNDSKMRWFLIVFLLPIIGALLYLFIGKNKKIITSV